MRKIIIGAAASAWLVAGSAASAADPLEPGLDLSGFYVAGQGFVSHSTMLRAAIRGDHQFSPDWTYVDGIIGFNAVSGNLLFGLEARVSPPPDADITARSDAIVPAVVAGQRLGGGFSSAMEPRFDSEEFISDIGLTRRLELTETYRMEKSVVPTLSFRVGYVWDSVVIFGRAGAGAVSIKETHMVRQIGEQCSSVRVNRIFHGQQWDDHFVDCVTSQDIDHTDKTTNTQLAPLASLGVGGEYHFDRFFVRADAELQHVFLAEWWAGNSGFSAWRAGIGAGFRF